MCLSVMQTAHMCLSVMQTAYSIKMYSIYNDNVKNMEVVLHLYLNTAVTLLLFLYIAVSVNSFEAEEVRLRKLVNIARPADLPEVCPAEEISTSINLAVTGKRAVLLIAARRKPNSKTKHVSCHFYHIIFSALDYV